ncbi:MAG: TetR/AcrR family transcriptional regulator [Acidimicrobiia bacterium]|nr:TetR/AcrR family transcriptional regulator [Acidimicrobiia bacterium]MDX2465885.1 TetR/AcrR family transcriptional regulator [Acidimicrobiia bacterium]
MSPENTREQILDGFADQLLESGYRGVSLKTITEAIGIQRPSLYHHFPEGKEQIYAEVALRMIETDAARVHEALSASGELTVRLKSLALLHTDDSRKVALDQRIYDATRYVSDETRTVVSTRYVDGLLAPVNAMMADAVAAGELRDLEPEFLTSTFFGMAQVVQGIPEDVAMPPDKRGGPRAIASDIAAEVVELFLSGAAPANPS